MIMYQFHLYYTIIHTYLASLKHGPSFVGSNAFQHGNPHRMQGRKGSNELKGSDLAGTSEKSSLGKSTHIMNIIS